MKYSTLFAVLASAAYAGGPLQLHPLNQPQVEGSSCSFWLDGTDGEKDYFEWDLLADGWINLGGSDVKLAFVRDEQATQPAGQTALGSSHVLTFAGPGVSLVLEARITRVCPEGDDSCEAWHEAGEIRVTSDGQTYSAPVRGICGS